MSKWLDEYFKGLEPKKVTLAEIKLRWFAEQNKVTKKVLTKYLK